MPKLWWIGPQTRHYKLSQGPRNRSDLTSKISVIRNGDVTDDGRGLLLHTLPYRAAVSTLLWLIYYSTLSSSLSIYKLFNCIDDYLLWSSLCKLQVSSLYFTRTNFWSDLWLVKLRILYRNHRSWWRITNDTFWRSKSCTNCGLWMTQRSQIVSEILLCCCDCWRGIWSDAHVPWVINFDLTCSCKILQSLESTCIQVLAGNGFPWPYSLTYMQDTQLHRSHVLVLWLPWLVLTDYLPNMGSYIK